MTIVDWARSNPATRAAWDAAERHVGAFADWHVPVPVASSALSLWLAVWMAGGIVEWRFDGLRRLAGGGRTGVVVSPPEDWPALVWRTAAGRRVFSHRAVWAAVADVVELGAVGCGLEGPPGVLSLWASRYIVGDPTPPWLYRDPMEAGCITDGRRRWAWAEPLLGVYGEWVGNRLWTPPSTWVASDGRLRSLRLFDGWWIGAGWNPVKVDPGGWYRWAREPIGSDPLRKDLRMRLAWRMGSARPATREVRHGA